jgi:drug/metabolite transporter (DMT)-like permease
MIILEKSKSLIGEDYSAYLFNLIANCIWMLGLLQGTEEKRINSVYMGQIRGFAVVLITFLIARIYNIRIDFPSISDLMTMNVRNFFMVIHGFYFALSFHYLEVPIVYTISNAGPIIVFIMDYFLNGIAVTHRQLLGILVSCLGITLAVNSHLIYWILNLDDTTTTKFEYIETSLEIKMLVSCGFLVIMIGWAYAIILTKRLKSTNAIQLNFHQGIMLLLCNSAAIFIVPTPSKLSMFDELELFLKVGLPLAIASCIYVLSVFMTKKSGNVTIVGFSTVLIGYGISIIRYGETPNIAGLIGSICIGVGLPLVLVK